MKLGAAVIALSAALLAQQSPSRGRQPLVFIDGNGGTYAGTASVGKHDETMELARVLLKSCPEISLTRGESNPTPDYILLLNRQEEHWGSAASQIMLLRASDRAVLWSEKKGTVKAAARAGCEAIAADWKPRAPTDSKSPDAHWWNPAKP